MKDDKPIEPEKPKAPVVPYSQRRLKRSRPKWKKERVREEAKAIVDVPEGEAES